MRALLLRLCLYAGFSAVSCHAGPPRHVAGDPGLPPGYLRTEPGVYVMRARVGSGSWTATQMMAAAHTGWTIRVEGEDSGTSIGFSLWMPGLRTNDRVGFFAGSPADLVFRPSGGDWKGTSGEVRILRVDPLVVEGTFRFSAVSETRDSVIPVTEGYFRVPLDTAAR